MKPQMKYVDSIRLFMEYGIKQASRSSYSRLSKFLITSGLKNSLSDSSLFVFNSDGILIWLILYVDDIVIIENIA